MRHLLIPALLAAAGFTATALAQELRADGERALEHLRILAADEMDGRRTGTAGAGAARAYIEQEFIGAGLTPWFGEGFEQPFAYTPRRSSETLDGINLVGVQVGQNPDGPVIVMTAHYDHLGNCGGQICNGADDNASGVAAMLVIAAALEETQPRHTIFFAALDAEENGLNGARALVERLQDYDLDVVLNINLDMLAINEDNELPAAGAFHFPFLREHIDAIDVASPTRVIQGYDSPEWGPNGDWTYSSDHAAFHEAGIPWIYYGVDFHEHYHQPTDEYDVVHHDFFVSNTQTVLNAVVYFDENLATVAEQLATHRNSASRTEQAHETGDGRFVKPGME
ncbi:M20/M25/M40 family metallo-hydrolase [Hyphobacterium sp.]|jgi:hypothetical protein|uniref:M20/M25/M40 family metallo-hydrolase n=1 Tax=Hyphobacterium sp. TaxID=2004662 RepID=UPI003BAC6474